MGMPAGPGRGEFRVVDIYRRAGDKLAENWVFIDLLHFWKAYGDAGGRYPGADGRGAADLSPGQDAAARVSRSSVSQFGSISGTEDSKSSV